jgi:hypothetical protein
VEAAGGLRAQHHGNVGQKKPRLHVKQVVATLKTLLDNAADHMPHKLSKNAYNMCERGVAVFAVIFLMERCYS